MKKTSAVLAGLLALGLPWVGCKKSEESKSESPKSAKEPAAKPSGPVELKLKLTVGSRVVQRMEVVQHSEMIMPRLPKPMKQEMTMGQEFALSVLKEREGGGHEVEIEFLANQMIVTMGERTLISFDSQGESTDDSNNPAAATFRKMVGARLKFLMDASNKLERIEGLEDFKKRLLTGTPKEMAGILSSVFSEDYFKQMAEHGQGLPPKPVNPGDTWPVQMEMVMGPLGTMVMDWTYTFKGWEKREKRRCALLEYTGTVKTKPGRSAGPMGMSIAIEDGTSSGKSWFDPEAGLFIDSAIKQDMRMLMTLPNMAGGRTNAPPQTQTLTNVMNQKITVKVVETSGGEK